MLRTHRGGSIVLATDQFDQVPFHVELHKEMNNPSNLHNFGSVDRILLGLVNNDNEFDDFFMLIYMMMKMDM